MSNQVSYERKVDFFNDVMKTCGVKKAFFFLYFDEKLSHVVFTEEEARRLFDSLESNDEARFLLYLLLSNKDKMELIDIIGEMPIFCYDYIFSGSEKFNVSNEVRRAILEKKEGWIEGSVFFSYLSGDAISEDFTIQLIDNLIEKRKNNFDVFHITYLTPEDFSKELRETIVFKIIKNVRNFNSSPMMSFIRFINNIESEEQRKVFICELITKDYFAINDYASKENLKQLLSTLSVDAIESILNFVEENSADINSFVSKELVISLMPVEYIIEKKIYEREYFNEVLKKLDFDSLMKIYSHFVSLEDGGEQYLDYEFYKLLIRTCKFGDKDELYNNYILKNNRFSNEEKFKLIRDCGSPIEMITMVNSFFEEHGVAVIDKQQVNSIFDLLGVIINLNKFPKIKEYVIKTYGVTNEENLVKLFKKIYINNLKGLEEANILNLINMDSVTYDKILGLVDGSDKRMDMGVVNTIVNAVLQRAFALEDSDTYNIFSRIEFLLRDKKEDNIYKVKLLLEEIDDLINIKGLLGVSLDINKLFDHDEEAIGDLHKVTNAYIARKREIYVEEKMPSAFGLLKLDKYYNKTYLKEKYVSVYGGEDIYYNFRFAMQYNEEEKALIDNKDLFLEIVKIKKGEKKPSQEEIKYLKIFESILNKMYENKKLKLPSEPEDAKYEYSVAKVESDFLYAILSDINPLYFKESVINNEGLFKRLSAFLDKYKFVCWGETFIELGKLIDTNMDETTISSLINNYSVISERSNFVEKLMTMLDYANAYSSDSIKFPLLVGKDNYSFIVSNPNPNKSASSRRARVLEIPSLVKSMYSRDSITVPSGVSVIPLENGKKISVSIGEVYDLRALTYGERTGSCLRVKGAFENLYKYCLGDKNGFHVRFDDPKTGEIVSRVSGIRNGNTVFLNELRTSLNDKYDTRDLVEAVRMVAKFLVESTRDSSNPIDNVIISNEYVMSEEKKEDLGIDDINVAFKGLHFNIENKGHVLYTSSADRVTLKEYKFGDGYVEEYKPYNRFVEISSNGKEIVNRMVILNEVLNGKCFEDIQLVEVNSDYCVYGNGWVVYLDEDNKMREFVIDRFRDDGELMEVIEDAKKKYFGGIANENKR